MDGNQLSILRCLLPKTKILTREALPNHHLEFMVMLHHYSGIQVYDLKPITRSFALHCGLDKVSEFNSHLIMSFNKTT
ncbi:hypothetical protein SASPL_149073 [Salvia splendens]|uniref:Uncharacterized protein n=1 Tax=Salvia splendens TaxID=180675 RepID=A0A8X8Z4W5_SALSN|nr:hypothetical protein SASPL_149073 [Salvia splendens]